MTGPGGIVHGSWRGDVVVEDSRGIGIIPLRRLKSMYRNASQRDAARANYAGRPYDRELLNAAWDQATTSGLYELDPCANCDERPGTQDMDGNALFCDVCCSAAAGSRYDDKD